MVVRVSVNLTFYIELEPQLDTRLHSRLERVHVRYENYTDSHPLHDVQKCQFIGRVISPVSGIASVNTCPNSTEAVSYSTRATMLPYINRIFDFILTFSYYRPAIQLYTNWLLESLPRIFKRIDFFVWSAMGDGL